MKAKVIQCFIYGLTFKANCNDLRNSKSLDLIDQLQNYGIKVFWNDPLIKEEKDINITNAKKLDALTHKNIQPDLIIICVGHEEYQEFKNPKYKTFLDKALLIYDIPNILRSKDKNLVSL